MRSGLLSGDFKLFNLRSQCDHLLFSSWPWPVFCSLTLVEAGQSVGTPKCAYLKAPKNLVGLLSKYTEDKAAYNE